MATYINTLKFRGLTDFTQNSNLLAINGSNSIQNALTPYEATYQINFQNHSLAVIWSPGSGGTSPRLVSAACYVGKYQIYDIEWDVDKPVRMSIDHPVGAASILMVAANPYRPKCHRTSFKEMSNFLNFNYETLRTGSGSPLASGDWFSEPSIQFTPTAGTNGYFRFSLKYYDKYLVQFAE
jgi:hypothetical protein